METPNLTDRVVVITGASGSLGKTTAKLLACRANVEIDEVVLRAAAQDS